MIDNSKKWNIVYVSKWSVDRLIAEELENDIIQTGINKDANDTTIWQWNFKILRRIHLVGKVSIQKIAERRGNMQQR